jgi:hypothetical protein
MMIKTSATIVLSTMCLILSGCQPFHHGPVNVPASAVWVDGTFIDCSVEAGLNKDRCTIYRDSDGEIIAEGLFVMGYPPRAATKTELVYVGYKDRSILLKDLQWLSLEQASDRDPTNRLMSDRLKSLAFSGGRPAKDCGKTTTSRPNEAISNCARAAFGKGKPFYVRYSEPDQVPYFSYGLAGDGQGNLSEVVYDSRALLNLGLSKNAQVFDDNRIRVTRCLSPIILGATTEGIVACVPPINERETAVAAQQKPIDTTLCAIAENPSDFNNKLVRIRGDVWGNFEYSELGNDRCSITIWFAYGTGEGMPGLEAYVPGGSRPGAEDAEGRRILPIPVKLVQDFRFRRFQQVMRARVIADARSEKTNPNEYVFHRVTATMIGRIDAVSPDIYAFHLKRTQMDKADFLGFGQMGLFDAQFILRSVESDAVLSAPSSIPSKQ